MIVLMSKIPGRHYNYREILPGVIAAKSSAPRLERRRHDVPSALPNWLLHIWRNHAAVTEGAPLKDTGSRNRCRARRSATSLVASRVFAARSRMSSVVA